MLLQTQKPTFLNSVSHCSACSVSLSSKGDHCLTTTAFSKSLLPLPDHNINIARLPLNPHPLIPGNRLSEIKPKSDFGLFKAIAFYCSNIICLIDLSWCTHFAFPIITQFVVSKKFAENQSFACCFYWKTVETNFYPKPRFFYDKFCFDNFSTLFVVIVVNEASLQNF